MVIAEVAASGRLFELTPSTAKAWKLLKQAAQAEGVELQIVSAFRSIAYQATIIRRKLEQGQDLASILKLLAPPGYSEHHSGCAIDIGCPEYPRLDAQFADTSAFLWLNAHAPSFGFYLSFPPDNAFGYLYEPWHWRFCG